MQKLIKNNLKTKNKTISQKELNLNYKQNKLNPKNNWNKWLWKHPQHLRKYLQWKLKNVRKYKRYKRTYLYNLNKPESHDFLSIKRSTGKITCLRNVNQLGYLQWCSKIIASNDNYNVEDEELRHHTWLYYNNTRLLDTFKFAPLFLKKRYPWKRKNLIKTFRYNKKGLPSSEILHEISSRRKFRRAKALEIGNVEKARTFYIWNICDSLKHKKIFKKKVEKLIYSNEIIKKKFFKKYSLKINFLKKRNIFNKHKIRKFFFKKAQKTLILKKIIKFKNKLNYISNFWIQYKVNTTFQDFKNVRKRYRRHIGGLEWKELKIRNPNFIPAPMNFLYKTQFILNKKKRIWAFSLPRWIKKKKVPWLISLMCRRKTYKINRKRIYRKEKIHWRARKYWWHLKFFRWRFPRKNAIRGNKFPRFTKILMKYIMWPFLGPSTGCQVKKMFKKLRKIHSLQNTFLCKFDNRLDILACRLGFAPNIYWSRIFINLGWIWVSNKNEPSVWTNTSLPFLATKMQGNDTRLFSQAIQCNTNFINMFVHLKSVFCKENSLYNNLPLGMPQFQEKLSKYSRVINSPFHIVNHKEMIHISPFLKKKLSFYFFNKIRKRNIPWYITWSHDRNTVLLNEFNNLHHNKNYGDRLDKRFFLSTHLTVDR